MFRLSHNNSAISTYKSSTDNNLPAFTYYSQKGLKFSPNFCLNNRNSDFTNI